MFNLRKEYLYVAVLFLTMPIIAQVGYYEGQIHYQNKTWDVALEFSKDSLGGTIAFCDFLEISAYQRQFEVRKVDNKIVLHRKQPSPRVDLKFEGKFINGNYVGKFDGIGIKDAYFMVQPAKKVDVNSYEINWINGEIMIAGTLLLPIGRGPFTTLIFTHGSNPETRETYYGAAMYFIKKGIACLIYDKRSVGESVGGDYRSAGFTDFAKDGLAGLELLKLRNDINPNQIGIFGHSQGGWVAPTAAGISNDIAFVIASAASPINAADQSVYHRKQVMKAEGFDSVVIHKAAQLRENLNHATKLCAEDHSLSHAFRQKAIDDIEANKSAPWFESSALPLGLSADCPNASIMQLLFEEPTNIWAKVKVPVYLTWGDADEVVPYFKRELITNALDSVGNKNVTVKIWPNVDHSIYMVNKSSEWDFPRECKGYFEEMAEWVIKKFDH